MLFVCFFIYMFLSSFICFFLRLFVLYSFICFFFINLCLSSCIRFFLRFLRFFLFSFLSFFISFFRSSFIAFFLHVLVSFLVSFFLHSLLSFIIYWFPYFAKYVIIALSLTFQYPPRHSLTHSWTPFWRRRTCSFEWDIESTCRSGSVEFQSYSTFFLLQPGRSLISPLMDVKIGCSYFTLSSRPFSEPKGFNFTGIFTLLYATIRNWSCPLSFKGHKCTRSLRKYSRQTAGWYLRRRG